MDTGPRQHRPAVAGPPMDDVCPIEFKGGIAPKWVPGRWSPLFFLRRGWAH